MKEAFENLQNAEVEPREKLKVTKADIVVALPLGEPYFNIHYREVGNDYDNIGFGSYDLNNVIRWREEEMTIISEVEAEYGNGWIPVEKALPEDCDNRFYMCIVENHEEDLPMFCQYDEDYGFGFWHDYYDEHTLGFVDSEFKTNEELGYEKVVAWMQIPKYTPTTD